MTDVLVHYTDEQLVEKIEEALTPIANLMNSSPAFKEAMRQWLMEIVEENNSENAGKVAAGVVASAIIAEIVEEANTTTTTSTGKDDELWEYLDGLRPNKFVITCTKGHPLINVGNDEKIY